MSYICQGCIEGGRGGNLPPPQDLADSLIRICTAMTSPPPTFFHFPNLPSDPIASFAASPFSVLGHTEEKIGGTKKERRK